MGKVGAPARQAVVAAVSAIAAGGSVRILSDVGVVLSSHEVTEVTDGLLTISPSLATGSGHVSHGELLSSDGDLIGDVVLALDTADIDEGSDVVLDPIRLEA